MINDLPQNITTHFVLAMAVNLLTFNLYQKNLSTSNTAIKSIQMFVECTKILQQLTLDNVHTAVLNRIQLKL